MNRILFEASEMSGDAVTVSDVRAEHILDVLHGEVGQVLKTGIVNGLIGEGVITSIRERTVTLECKHTRAALPSWVDLILAPPRPRAMKRLLPQLATLGVGRIILVGAQKVEKAFWGAQLLKEEVYHPLLVEGLMQGGTTELPRIECYRSFTNYIKNHLAEDFPASHRLVAHPTKENAPEGLSAAAIPGSGSEVARRPLLAIGPEGGWTDAELELLFDNGFTPFSLGERILRTDTALIAILGKLM